MQESQLNFIPDSELRTNLLIDLGAIDRALSNGEWKAATVLAGSAIEALLLWDLQNRRQSTFPAAAGLPPGLTLASNTVLVE